MKDGETIQFGGYNTENEAYLGFRINGFCSGTTSYCNSISNTTSRNFLSFLNGSGSLYNMSILFQANQYDD
jgi:hypothetical protein